MNADEEKRPPSPMKELHTDLVAALKETVAEARKPGVALEERARILEHCAQAFSAIDQALTARITANIQRRPS